MPFDQQAVKQKALDHLAMMAAHPGWKAQAWHSAKALAQDWPEMFGDLRELLTERLKSSGVQKSSGG